MHINDEAFEALGGGANISSGQAVPCGRYFSRRPPGEILFVLVLASAS